MKVIHVVSMSSGKDSTATALLALEAFPKSELRFVFADTGNEHALVYEYLDYLEQKLGITIDRLKVDFTDRIMAKRMFIARDQRVGRDKNGRKKRWTNKAKRRALKALVPSGNPYLDLCLWKGRFPARRSQFCTEHLKTIPLRRYVNELCDDYEAVVSWQGVRRDESAARANILNVEQLDDSVWVYRPIADASAMDCFEIMARHGVEPNPLYKMGFSRVGCFPCINCGKAEIREIANREPAHIDRIDEWEQRIGAASKRGFTTMFHRSRGIDRNDLIAAADNIWATVQWAKTSHGGRQFDLIHAIEGSPACASSYGLCE